MSWVRFSAESEVYVYNSNEGVVCWFTRSALDRFPDLPDPLVRDTDEEMAAELKALRERGVKIPDGVASDMICPSCDKPFSQNDEGVLLPKGHKNYPGALVCTPCTIDWDKLYRERESRE